MNAMLMMERIRDKAHDSGYTIAALERALLFGVGTISKWHIGNPTLEKLEKVAILLGVQIDYLIGRTDDDRPPIEERDPRVTYDVRPGDLSADAVKIAALWDTLDDAGKAIIQGDIYRRLEALEVAPPVEGNTLRKAT